MPELIERYLAELERRLPGRRGLRRRAIAEASRHLHDAFADEQAAGLDEQAAEQRAIDRFGPARDVADAFRASLPVRHVTTRRVAALVTAGLAAALIATIVQETSTPDSPRAPQAEAAAPAAAPAAPPPGVSPRERAGLDRPASDTGQAAPTGAPAPVPPPTAPQLEPVAAAAAWSFSSWAGTRLPGKPASPEAVARFERWQARALVPLPGPMRVRLLDSLTVAGERVDLYGIRSGDLICLAALSTLPSHFGRSVGCTTEAGLAAAGPLIVIRSDLEFGFRKPFRDFREPNWVRVTFGFAADQVKTLRPQARSAGLGLGLNVFLVAVPRPPLRDTLDRIDGKLRDGSRFRTTVPAGAIFDASLDPQEAIELRRSLPGPTAVERFPEPGRVGWADRDEEPGVLVPRRTIPGIGTTEARAVRPNPESAQTVLLVVPGRDKPGRPRRICSMAVAPFEPVGSGGCVPLPGAIPDSPFLSFGSGFISGPGPTEIWTGLLTDEAASLELITRTQRRQIPIAANTFVAEIPRANEPINNAIFKLVVRDKDGAVIGIYPDQGFSTEREQPDESQRRRILEHVGPGAFRAAIDVAPSNLGGTCWWWTSTGQPDQIGCFPRPGDPELPRALIGPLPRAPIEIYAGVIAADVGSLTLQYEDGTSQQIPIVERFVLFTPDQPVTDEAVLIVRDTGGNELDRLAGVGPEPALEIPDTPPLQRASDHGATVSVYANSIVVIDPANAEPDLRSRLDLRRLQTACTTLRTDEPPWKQATWGGRLEQRDGRFITRISSLYEPRRASKTPPPYDYCVLETMRARRWRDANATTPTVQFTFTSRARRYLAERSTAEDLRLLLRTRRMAEIRRQERTAASVVARFPGGELVELPTRTSRPPAGTVGVWTSGSLLRLSELTPAGRLLWVELDRRRVSRHNLHGLTFPS
ncbi:MAG: permease prefix domain 1-containing protein [Thermoleophilia bacterium]